ncbi:hypothetical protein EVAR_41755_1 [Eumeta japonica]|uniref:Uncharacterized protein n=1 Tax=Eumeta variegata TaxID=151549 RepID=A0A4C1W066_EUMVA|nr:hypothetical protein EVAR_41755_1 [Eumeta japonica]
MCIRLGKIQCARRAAGAGRPRPPLINAARMSARLSAVQLCFYNLYLLGTKLVYSERRAPAVLGFMAARGVVFVAYARLHRDTSLITDNAPRLSPRARPDPHRDVRLAVATRKPFIAYSQKFSDRYGLPTLTLNSSTSRIAYSSSSTD